MINMRLRNAEVLLVTTLLFVMLAVSNAAQSQALSPGDATQQAARHIPNKVFIADCLSRDSNKGMWVLDSLGDTLEHVSSSNGFASWSSDDLRFVCIDPRKNLKVLDISNPGESIVIKIPTDEWPETPAWCPTSDLIAFSAKDSTGVRQIHTVRVSRSGEAFRALTNSDAHCISPAWTPDGARILYAEYQPTDESLRLITMRNDGSDPQVLYTSDSLYLVNPVYSPDGKYIVAEGKGTGNLFRLNPDGSGLMNLTRIGQPLAPFGAPKFGNDSVWVYFVGRRGPDAQMEIFRAPTTGGVVQQVTPREPHLEFTYVAPNR